MIRRTPEGLELHLHIQPRSPRTELAGTYAGAVRIRVAAPPVDDAANQELIRFLADVLDVPRRQIEIRAGHRARRKTVLFRDIPPSIVRRAFSLVP